MKKKNKVKKSRNQVSGVTCRESEARLTTEDWRLRADSSLSVTGVIPNRVTMSRRALNLKGAYVYTDAFVGAWHSVKLRREPLASHPPPHRA